MAISNRDLQYYIFVIFLYVALLVTVPVLRSININLLLLNGTTVAVCFACVAACAFETNGFSTELTNNSNALLQ